MATLRRTRNGMALAGVALLGAMAVAAPADATLIDYVVTGTIGPASGTETLFGSSVSPGAAFTATIVVDDAVPGAHYDYGGVPSPPDQGYEDPGSFAESTFACSGAIGGAGCSGAAYRSILSLTLTIDGKSFVSDAGAPAAPAASGQTGTMTVSDDSRVIKQDKGQLTLDRSATVDQVFADGSRSHIGLDFDFDVIAGFATTDFREPLALSGLPYTDPVTMFPTYASGYLVTGGYSIDAKGVQHNIPGADIFLNATGVRVFAAVPEPATWALAVGGFAMIGAAMRRRRPAIA